MRYEAKHSFMHHKLPAWAHYHEFQVCRLQEESTFILQQNDFKHYMPAHEIMLSGMLFIAQRCTIPVY